MSKGRKSSYPERPVKRNRPKSSEHIHSRRKVWLSEGTENKGGLDISPRIGLPWWKSPLMKGERLKRAASRRST